MTALALIFTLAAIGISETVYLIKQRMAGAKPVCFIGGGCSEVLESKYNKFFGLIYNDLLGLVFYVLVSVLTGLMVLEIGNISVMIFGLIIGGALASVYFTYLQWQVIKKWCFWCLMSAITTWLMVLILLIGGFSL